MRPPEGASIPETKGESFKARVRRAVDSLKPKGTFSQLATEGPSLNSSIARPDVQDSKTKSLFEQRLHPVTSPASSGTKTESGTAKQPAKPKERRPWTTRAKVAVAAGIGVPLTILGSYGVYETIPAVHSAIESIIGGEKVPSTFDNHADSSVIRPGTNAVFVSPDGLNSLLANSIKPVEKGKLPEVAVLSPVKLNGNQDIGISTLYENVLNWMTGKFERHAVGKEFSIPNAGTEIMVSVANAEVFQLHHFQKSPDAPSYFRGAVVRFKGPDGVPYELMITPQSDLKQLMPVDILNNAPLIGDNTGFYLPGADSNPEVKGLSLPPSTIIIRTATNNADIDMILGTPADNISDINNSSGGVVQSNFNLITTPDGKVALVQQ